MQSTDSSNQARVPIRVYGDRNWTDKGYKTFVVERTNLIKEVRIAPKQNNTAHGVALVMGADGHDRVPPMPTRRPIRARARALTRALHPAPAADSQVTAQALRRFALDETPRVEDYTLCQLVNNVSGTTQFFASCCRGMLRRGVLCRGMLCRGVRCRGMRCRGLRCRGLR